MELRGLSGLPELSAVEEIIRFVLDIDVHVMQPTFESFEKVAGKLTYPPGELVSSRSATF